MSRCGPLTHMWCMRYEAKHRFFKQIAKVTGNFKNIAKSLSFRHQRHICYVLSNPASFLLENIETGPGMTSTTVHVVKVTCSL